MPAIRWVVMLWGALVLAASPHRAAATPLTSARLDLSGAWEFELDEQDRGRAERWFEGTRPFPRTLQVPGAWNSQGVAYTSETLLREYEQKYLNGRDVVPGPDRESAMLFHVFPGPGWYRRSVGIPADWSGHGVRLVLEGVHREAEVWVDGKAVGTHCSYLIPARFDISEHAKPGTTVSLVIRVDARRDPTRDPLMGTMDTCDFVYASWGGLHKQVVLEAMPPSRIEDVFVAPEIAAKKARVRVQLAGASSPGLRVSTAIRDADGATVASQTVPADGTEETILELPLPDPKLWSPKTPHLYSAEVRLLAEEATVDSEQVRFGMREFRVAGRELLLNGRPIFLRGYGDDSIFPNTLAPPTDREEYRRRLQLARDYGFNFVRHHSWVPPREYLEVADELGMMLQVEFPFAYRSYLPKLPEMWKFAFAQWREMIRGHRNHASIVAWCMGNELYDTPHHEQEWYRAAKELDPTRPVIDTDGCTFADGRRTTLDYLVVPFAEGESIGFGDGKYAVPPDVTKPVIGHEMGYFVTLHDLSQEKLFRTGLRPYWLALTRSLVTDKGLEQIYPEWLKASYRLQAACLKTNQEATRRSPLAGGHVWLFQDYPNCAEGVVDMFFRPKGVSAAEFRRFNSPTVLLMDTPRRSWWGGEQAVVTLGASRYEDDPTSAAELTWTLAAGDEVLSSGLRQGVEVHDRGRQELVSLSLPLPVRPRFEKLTLTVKLKDQAGEWENAWNLWIFPRELSASLEDGVRYSRGILPLKGQEAEDSDVWSGEREPGPTLLVADRLDTDTLAYLRGGGRVFLVEPEPAFAVEKTNYRLSSWDGGGPSGTSLMAQHPSLGGMAPEGWCDLQFYPLIQGSKTINLDSLPARVDPVVRCIDRPNRLADRAYLFETAVGEGKLLVSGFNFRGAIPAGDPAARYLFHRLIRYASSPMFAPNARLPEEALVMHTRSVKGENR